MRQLIHAAMHPHSYSWGLRPWTRHSVVLVVGGLVYVTVGAAYAITDPTHDRAAALAFATRLAPLPAWGVLWMVAGAAAMCSARWPPASEKWGYSVLSTLSALWAAFHALSPFFGTPFKIAFLGVLVWAFFAFLWWAIAGLWNPDPNLRLLAPGHDGREP